MESAMESAMDAMESANVDIKIKIISDKIRVLCKNCKRILLVNPTQIQEKDFDIELALQKRYSVFPPYGIGIINKKLKDNGYISDILDLNYEVISSTIQGKKTFRYDIWKDRLRENIENFKPDIVGITCMFTMTVSQMYIVADFIKNINKDLVIVVGGVHPSAAAEDVLTECKSVDFVCLYECDSSFIDFLNFINGDAPIEKLRQLDTIYNNTYYTINNRLREIDIDTIPEYGQLPIDNYHFVGKIGAYSFLLTEDIRVSTILSNRGCRGTCTYCSVNVFYGRGVRSRSVKVIVDEMELMKNKYNISHFMWLDDDLLFNEERAIELFNEIIKRQLNITWDASNGVVATSITQNVIDAAYKSGCIGLHLGIESGNPEILKAIRKPSKIEHFKMAAKILRQYPNIFTKGFLMVGFLGETIGQILDTINLAVELKLDWYPIQILTVFPSTEVQKYLVKDRTIKRKDFKDKFFIGITGGQRLREMNEKIDAKEFINILEEDKSVIPSEDEIKDIWFIIDYKVNYEKILIEDRPIKLKMLQKMLLDICNRVKENPLSTLYLGIVEQKLGNHNRSKELKNIAKMHIDNSINWQKRFEILNLYKLF